MSDRTFAEQRMARAKAVMTRAAQAALAGWPLARQMASAALEGLEQARAALRALDADGGVKSSQMFGLPPVADIRAQKLVVFG